jgi:hypothetical protein
MAVIEQLACELELYDENRERLLGESLGKYVLIHDREMVGTYDTEADAVAEGYRRFGNVPFLVKLIAPVEEPANFLSPQVRF